jgi:hypothetical protein
MIRRCLLVAIVLLPAGCSGNPGDPEAAPEADAREAVVRYLLPRATKAGGERAIAYLQMNDRAEAERFCARLRDQPVAVRPYPEDGQLPAEPGAYVVRVSDVYGGVNEARVMVLDYPASAPPRCGTPYPVRVRRDADRWVVVD